MTRTRTPKPSVDLIPGRYRPNLICSVPSASTEQEAPISARLIAMPHLELDAECDTNLSYNPNICRVDDLGNPMRTAKKLIAAGRLTSFSFRPAPRRRSGSGRQRPRLSTPNREFASHLAFA